MRFSTALVSMVLAGASHVAAETFNVMVGQNNGLVYDPPNVIAKSGDIVSFHFLNKNHTVTQSTFASPCVPKADGVNSGFQAVPPQAGDIPAWSITITNDTAPLWFFCNQGPHCRAGMVFAVNPNAERTFEAFLENAKGGGGATAGPNASPIPPPASGSASPAATPAASVSTGAGASAASSTSSSAGDASTTSSAAVEGTAAGAVNAASAPAITPGGTSDNAQTPPPRDNGAFSSKSVSVMGFLGVAIVGGLLL